MIKKFNDFLIEATNKFGNTFSYIEETFKRYSCDTMTIIHNESNIKFDQTPKLEKFVMKYYVRMKNS